MDRKEFVKKTLLLAAAGVTMPPVLRAKNIKLKKSTYDQLMDLVGFNHSPVN